MNSSVSPKNKIWSLRVFHHISNAVYHDTLRNISEETRKCWSVKYLHSWQHPPSELTRKV